MDCSAGAHLAAWDTSAPEQAGCTQAMLVLLCLPHFGSSSSRLAELLFLDELKSRKPKAASLMAQ